MTGTANESLNVESEESAEGQREETSPREKPGQEGSKGGGAPGSISVRTT